MSAESLTSAPTGEAADAALLATLAEHPPRGCGDAAGRGLHTPAIAGVDEAGRGPWAGPVVACAVILPEAVSIPGLRDSKRLTPQKRLEVALRIRKQCAAWSIAWSLPEEIDRANILQATLAAMRRAVEGLPLPAAEVLVDGNRLPPLRQAARAIVGGDDRVAAIAAASVLAKTFRDGWMQHYDALHPGYGFAIHKGYGTAQHAQALARLGPCALHRRSFAPVAAVLASPT
jgi:ribonuclease HII